MLSPLFAISSVSTANQIKPYLDNLISHSQTGFVSCRYISESTRLAYDIMNFMETNNIPGLLMLIDLKKTFDLISWTFIYKTVAYLGFGSTFVQWIQLFNKDIQARAMQCQITSEIFNIVDKRTQFQVIYIF